MILNEHTWTVLCKVSVYIPPTSAVNLLVSVIVIYGVLSAHRLSFCDFSSLTPYIILIDIQKVLLKDITRLFKNNIFILLFWMDYVIIVVLLKT